MDVIAIVIEGESAVYILDKLHPVLQAPGDNLLPCSLYSPVCISGFSASQEHHEGNACAVGHLLQLIETRVKEQSPVSRGGPNCLPHKLTVYVFCSSFIESYISYTNAGV